VTEPLVPFHLFDPASEVHIVERRLPHWSQAGALCFITWRTQDSMPKPVLDRWFEERANWLRKNGIDSADSDWRRHLDRLPPAQARNSSMSSGTVGMTPSMPDTAAVFYASLSWQRSSRIACFILTMNAI
jgi:hypothetical protein